ncbi:MAG: hypothetical protein M0R30_13710 [Methanoregula sp.]|uniref:TolB family protein n=1 Tax=Methanoregula sp. TaxID=2052170 RepID=UPI0025CF693B|nr:hypothetical protein [Methanoregula sp.]MCK9632682.1 hypothetical protein [Methanoregula sp.]
MKAGIVVFLILLSLILCTVPCSGADSFDAYLVAKGDSEKYNAIACDDGNVAWVEYEAGPGSGNYSRAVYRYNISGGRKELVIRDTSWKRDLAFSGDRYVWSDGRGIFLYDEEQEKLTFLYSSGSDQYSPAIDGNTVLWVETSEREYFLVVYDVISGTHRTVVSSTGSLGDPAISGNRVVYSEAGLTHDRIMLLDITTGEKTVLCDEPGSRAMPAIDGDRVVWIDGRNGPYQVFLHDLKSGEARPVSPSDSFQMYPDISGNLVVWEDYRNSPAGSRDFRGNGDIRLYDRNTNMTRIVAEGPFSLEFPRVSGEYVVWSDGRNDAHDIFLYHYSGNRTHTILGIGDGTGYSATPTVVPTPDTRVRYYSTISDNEIEWYSLEPPVSDKEISFELRWNDPASSLSLTLVSPGGSTWHFSDADDSRTDRAVRMTISGVSGEYLEPGKWTVAVAGDSVKDTVPYDLCWY